MDYELEDYELTEIENKRVFGNEKNKLVIQNIGIIVLEFLLQKFDNVFEYNYTKKMEDILDEIAKGANKKEILCGQCLNDIDSIIKVNTKKKEDIILDANHVYMIGKYGPVIKETTNEGITKFHSVKKDIDLDKLRKGEYKVDDIRESNTLNTVLGEYEGSELLLKRGKYGLYVTWGTNKQSINDIGISEANIELNDVIQYIEANSKNSNNIIRVLTKDLAVRNGKYGDYIFYKSERMSKPKFYKLSGFKENYKECDKKVLVDWISETYFKK